MLLLFMSELLIYSTVFALLLILGETVVVLRARKFWPLSFDDYAVAALLLVASLWLADPYRLPVLLAAWAFSSGNLYAMLFTRMDPNGGSRERLPVLAVALVASLMGCALTLIEIFNLGAI
jgi:hypothetical protein